MVLRWAIDSQPTNPALVDLMELDKILQWNCNGIRSHHEELQDLLRDTDPDVVCLQELKLQANNYKMNSKYDSYLTIPPGANFSKGGVLIGIKTSFPHKRIPIRTTLQAVAIETMTLPIKSICSIYLPPATQIQRDDLVELFEQLPRPCVIAGDFNAHNHLWYDHSLDARGALVERLMVEFNLTCLNTDSPTFYRPSFLSSSIDLSLISSARALDFRWTTLNDQYGSDHFPILLKSKEDTPLQPETRYNFESADWDKFKQNSTVRQTIDSFASIEEAYEYITTLIIAASQQSIPTKKTHKKRRVTVPWWNKGCDLQKKICRTAFRRMKNNPSQNNIIAYRRRSAAKRRFFKMTRRASWKTYVSTLTSKTPTKYVWEKIKKINGKYIPKPQPVLKHQGNLIVDPMDVANILASHYAEVSSNNQIPCQAISLTDLSNNDEIFNVPFTQAELSSALNRTKDKSSPGEDNINNIMLKHLPDQTLDFLLELFNVIWVRGIIPLAWKTSVIVPIIKPGKPSNDPKSYRPISLTSCLCKLFEKMVNSRLMWWLEENNKISDKQFAFRKNFSTIEPIAQLTTEIMDQFNQSKPTTAVLFDIEKAYDTIDRNKIIQTMRNMGIAGNMLKFIHNYIHHRQIKVKIGCTLSAPKQTSAGVPQGGILSVTCFIAAINDILGVLPHSVGGYLYADDLIIYHSSKRPSSSARILQLAINRLSSWAENQGLKFSTSKTEAICFSKRIKRNEVLPHLTLQGSQISYKETVKYLGMTLDRHLNWSAHVKLLKAKASRSLNILRVVSSQGWGPDRAVLKRLYWAICKSKIDYGAPLYSSASSSILKTLDSVHNDALRICTGAFRSSPTESLYVESNSPPLELIRQEVDLRYLFKLKGSHKHQQSNLLNTEHDHHYQHGEGKKIPFGVRAREAEASLNLTATPIVSKKPALPPWQTRNIHVCHTGNALSKANSSAIQLAQEFYSHLHSHSTTYYVFTDGSKFSDRVGFASFFGHKTIKGSLPREASILTAELVAIEVALTEIETTSENEWTLFTDSESALKILKQYDPTHPIARSIINKINTTLEAKQITFCKVPSHVGVSGNEKADTAAKEGSTLAPHYTHNIPLSDFFPIFRRHRNLKWQEAWNNSSSKLHTVKPTIKEWPAHPLTRANDVKITRLRIGHTRLTHGHYMSMTRPPECDLCIGTILTVKHILIDCPKHRQIRQKHGIPNTLEGALGVDSDPAKIVDFLAEANILNAI